MGEGIVKKLISKWGGPHNGTRNSALPKEVKFLGYLRHSKTEVNEGEGF